MKQAEICTLFMQKLKKTSSQLSFFLPVFIKYSMYLILRSEHIWHLRKHLYVIV